MNQILFDRAAFIPFSQKQYLLFCLFVLCWGLVFAPPRWLLTGRDFCAERKFDFLVCLCWIRLGLLYIEQDQAKKGKVNSVMINHYWIQDFSNIQPIKLWIFHKGASMERCGFWFFFSRRAVRPKHSTKFNSVKSVGPNLSSSQKILIFWTNFPFNFHYVFFYWVKI
jgi:hypothetical protein